MKNNSLKYFAILIAFSVIGFWGCKKINGNEIAVNISNIYTSPVSVQFQNANSTSPNPIPGGNDGFSVSITGPGAQYVVASDGSTVFKASHGILTLALRKEAAPSINNPISFNISAVPGGNFAPVTQTIIVTDTGVSSAVIRAVEYAHPVDGAASILQSKSVNNGVSPGIVLNTTPTGSLTEAATITIPAGTEVWDINGKIISTDTIRAYAIQYGTGTEASLSAFPGGYNATNVLDKNKQPIAGGGTFVTAGLLQINMEAKDGTPIKNFSSPIQLNVEINNTLQNPTTGANMKDGDTIPIWSLNDATGQWQYETTVTIKTNSNGKLYASFGAKHLSTWNLDFFYQWGSNKSLKVNFHMPAGVTSTNLWPELVTSNLQYLSGLYTNNSWSQGATLYDGYSATLTPAPNIPNCTFVVDKNRGDGSTNIATVSPKYFNPSTVGTVDVTIAPPPVPDYVNLRMNVWGHCANQNTNINVGTYVYFYPSGVNFNWQDFQYCYLATNGWSWNNPVRLKTNTAYVCGTWYGGSWNSNIIQVKKQNYTFPTTTADGVTITGNGVYNAANNTLTINCTFQVNCN